ncbi:MAG TPA: hybrid sensor histidine kinase/response regulator [Cyanobacteria bacterium UBA8803]|nr:hybrid sensor histidine kinase/response regulator [Cyanobacteria bacterium UBA8803]
MNTPPAKGNILIVDDTPDNLRLLSNALTERGYKVRGAIDGPMALMGAKAAPPDLILLDINMPDMNGYEICSALKADEITRDIPVIFISGLDAVFDKVKAFAVGGRDYITKPFQLEEVVARIENQLTLRTLQKQLQEKNQELQQEICDRQKAEQTLRIFLHSISHDLRNPVTGMLMVLNNLLNRPWSNNQGSEVDSEANSLRLRSTLESMAASCQRQLNLINSLVETHEYEVWGVPLECQSLLLHELIEKLVEEWQPMLATHQATLKNLVSLELPPLRADPNQLWRVFSNLIANALKHNPPGITITLSAEVIEKNYLGEEEQEPIKLVRCDVADDGVGMTPEQCDRLFELYKRGSLNRQTRGLGLGLYLCRQIITAHGGKIEVITQPKCGATFWFTLPVAVRDEG